MPNYLQATFTKVNDKAKRLGKLIGLLFVAIVFDLLIYFSGLWVYENKMSEEAMNKEVAEIYNKIIVASGLSNVTLPLHIINSPIDNAYVDGERMVVYTGLIKSSTWDGIAYTLGHELAHHQLSHDSIPELYKDTPTAEKSEALADKLGAFYMMKAGYDICVAREEWKVARDTRGNYLGENHPNYSYRYDELNVNCE